MSESKKPFTELVTKQKGAADTTLWAWIDRARKAGVIRLVNIRQTIFNLVGLVVFYPAAAEARELSGDEPFSAKARGIRKEELRIALRGMLESQ